MNGNRLPNRYSLTLKSAAVGPSGLLGRTGPSDLPGPSARPATPHARLLPVHGYFPAADFPTPTPPTKAAAASAAAVARVAATAAAVRAPGIPKTLRMSTRTCAPSLWSCGVVVGVIFCLMNRQANAAPVGETGIDRR